MNLGYFFSDSNSSPPVKFSILSDLDQCGPNFCDSRANLCNAANMAGRKQNTKTMAVVKIKSNTFN
jgi:hypothetical protein